VKVDLTGQTLGSYQIIEELGRGGMAVVYRAYQQSLNRFVAIKVLPPQLAFEREFVDRFLREARAAAGLRHPNVVVIHDVGEQGGIYYIVMEYLKGQTLRDLVEREGSLPPARAARILEQMASSLDYAHGEGFVHRDVKPANIFIGEGDRVTLTDFGIAKAASEAQQLTRTGTLVGTPEYMSPEQAEGRTVDHRTDLYAMGVVLYQMLTGRVPFKGTTAHATLHALIYEPPPPPRQLNPDLSQPVETVLLKSVAKEPDQRFQRGAEMVAALRAAIAGRPLPAGVVAATAAATKPVREPAQKRSPLVWILGGLAAILVAVLGLLLLMAGGGGDGAPTPKPTQEIVVVTSTPSSTEIAPTATGTATPEPLPPPTEAPTLTRPVLVTRTPVPVPTSTPEPVSTATSVPTSTSTATSTAQATTRPTKPPPTRTEPPAEDDTQFPAPTLLGPPDGQEFAPADEILLEWQPVGQLPSDGFYEVVLTFAPASDPSQTWTDETPWVKEARWRLSEHDYLPGLSADEQFRWSVRVMRQTGTNAEGQPTGTALSPASATRTLIWRRPSEGGGGGGGGGGGEPTSPAP
jgi:serine/threonine-protein kinase